MVELGLIQEEKPKQVGVKRKKQPAPAQEGASPQAKQPMSPHGRSQK